MPQAHSTAADSVSELINAIAARLSDAILAGAMSAISGGAASSLAAPARRGPGRPPKAAGGKACLVAGCGRKTVAKGLCQGHYRKANRLGVANKLDKGALAKLSQDGRATRWAKKK